MKRVAAEKQTPCDARWLALVLLILCGSPLWAQVDGSGAVAYELFDYPPGPVDSRGGFGWRGAWRQSRILPGLVVDSAGQPPGNSGGSRMLLIAGQGDRNNPLRRKLLEPVQNNELFVRFRLRYAAEPDEAVDDAEFFVLWLDRLDGGDRSTHAAGVPNIGVHVADRGPMKGKTVFMIRIDPARTVWSEVELEKDRDYQVVARLGKTTDEDRASFDQLDLWVDPQREDLGSPIATLVDAEGINLIQWIGFSTGRKTEPEDRIYVDDLVLSRSWDGVIDLARPRTASEDSSPLPTALARSVEFSSEVYPLLRDRCFECHSGDHPESGFRLDIHREFSGYSTGVVLAEPGRSGSSRLIERVAAEASERRMPPDEERLTDEEIGLLRAWIDQGLKWDDSLLPTPRRTSEHWAFQPITRPSIPVVPRKDWIRTPVDSFVAAAHVEHQVRASPKAPRHVLVRRLFLDLIGLPPTPRQIDEFCSDPSPLAYERLVDRLLSSPHYGERWGRYWLDLARWAESQGYQHDIVRPYAWRYRDYVVQSFNADRPYDEFLRQQLAGDELQPYSDENLIATGFLGAARISGNQMDKAVQRNDVLVDIVNATSGVMLGLTLQCAQCHNHKFDPLSQRDYYRLQGFFVNGQLGNLLLRDPANPNPTEFEEWIPASALAFYRSEAKKLERKKQWKPTDQPYTWGFYSPVSGDASIKRLPVVNRDPIPWQPAVLAYARARVLIRGDVRSPGVVVGSGWPEVLASTPSELGSAPRTRLAEWMADPSNPLVSRVWANRIWQFHFGRGLVSTPSDFGTQGARPTHPALLDWLAAELIAGNWSTKQLQRQIVLSSTYRQQRRHDEANAAIDPDNRLLWTWPRRRLEAEVIRDAALVAAGELDRSIGGIGVSPEREESQPRRTIYLFQQRSDMPAVMQMFDAPDGIASCSRRRVSTVALQPLFMLNSEFMIRRAEATAEAVCRTVGDAPDQQVQAAFLRTLGRPPDPDELRRSITLIGDGSAAEPDQDGRRERLVQLCHALMNVNEFVYVP